MLEIPEILRKSAENCGFVRETYNESKIPTTMQNVCILPFFGDHRASFVLSTLLLKRFREESKGSKYFVLCSWPGHRILYPYVDEYWSIKDTANLKQLFSNSCRFQNTSDIVMNYFKDLNQCFYEIINIKEIEKFYKNGLTDDFMAWFRTIKRFFPMIPSKGVLGVDFNRTLANRLGYKIMVYPSTHIKVWKNRVENKKVLKEFWVSLVNRLLKEGHIPVIINNYGTHDLSKDFGDKCVYVNEYDLSKIMSIMRAVDCVLDVFSDFSRLAGIARTPYIACVERSRYTDEKDYELDDLCLDKLPRQYIFSFTTLIERGEESGWDVNLFDNIIVKLNDFLPKIDSDTIPTASELNEEVSYKTVRVRKLKRIGAKFIKVQRD